MFSEGLWIIKSLIGSPVAVFPRIELPLLCFRESAGHFLYNQKCSPEITFKHSCHIDSDNITAKTA